MLPIGLVLMVRVAQDLLVKSCRLRWGAACLGRLVVVGRVLDGRDRYTDIQICNSKVARGPLMHWIFALLSGTGLTAFPMTKTKCYSQGGRAGHHVALVQVEVVGRLLNGRVRYTDMT